MITHRTEVTAMGISSPKWKFLINAYILRSTGWWVLKQVVLGPTDPM
jgi:hypothetical protein